MRYMVRLSSTVEDSERVYVRIVHFNMELYYGHFKIFGQNQILSLDFHRIETFRGLRFRKD